MKNFTALQEQGLEWFQSTVLSGNFVFQLSLVALAIMAGFFVRQITRKKIEGTIEGLGISTRGKGILTNIAQLIMQATSLILLWGGARLTESIGYDVSFADAVSGLLLAWIAIRLIAQLIENSAVRNMFVLVIWAIAALAIFGVLDETTAVLNDAGMNIGTFRLSALSVIKGLLALFLLLYAALFVSGILEQRIWKTKGLSISSRVLIGKVIRVVLVTSALLIGVTAAGVDLSLFAVFSGAVGLGVGFGLQKGISNLFSGMLLLLDKSIKPGDIIELPSGSGGEATFGWVEHMGARYTEIITRDNKSYLIPNEDFITQQVVNWSHGNTLIRLEVKFGVHYDSDPHQVCALAIEATQTPERVVDDPKPVCWLTEFGDSSLNFKLRFWIKDAEKGVTNVRGMVMMALWDTFKENGIKIPYPHRDVYIRGDATKTA